MQQDFVKVDLHIHTPASSCYKGEKSDNEYLRILRQAKAQALKVIAFTDHNSIKGYTKLLELKERIIGEERSLSSITDSEQAKSRLKELKKDIELFDNILVLPGVEFEARPGIHILIIFNPNIDSQKIEKFLEDGGYRADNSGAEDDLPPENSSTLN